MNNTQQLLDSALLQYETGNIKNDTVLKLCEYIATQQNKIIVLEKQTKEKPIKERPNTKIIRGFYACPKTDKLLNSLLNTFVNYPPFFEDCLLDPRVNADLYFCFGGASIAQKAIFNGLVNLIYNKMRVTKRQLKRAIYKNQDSKNQFLIDRELNKLEFRAAVDRADGLGLTVICRPEIRIIKTLCQYKALSDMVNFYNEAVKDGDKYSYSSR